MTAALNQKIAQKEQEIANLKAKVRKQETSQKIIIGGMMLALAKNDAERAQMLIDDIKNNVTRDSDIRKLSSVIDELSASDDAEKDTTDTNDSFTRSDDH
ncbi:hypothetical protein [uncultured Psychrobacter sp.]|jgi:multidrug resistance efflux pump|uniref:hypothetical protein n=1 Tax=uncultured Psychrobacter sp. TaxID=259303 RepID=UPI002620AF66|nr:hypothetical protein [uncultured Psychrobacter sp.]